MTPLVVATCYVKQWLVSHRCGQLLGRRIFAPLSLILTFYEEGGRVRGSEGRLGGVRGRLD